ncbi:GTP pyrophosphokinase [Candidatus Peregrinibacteria bacterium]|nr:GTP pyrophosphokinase [Candidatus Peregrinibacteria bacterium]
MNKLEKAIQIALKAHEGQTDKGGNTYVLHPLRLMVQMPTEQLQTIAVLHDVVEDSAYTFEDLAKEGFPEEVISAIRALTKKEGEQYNDFINRVKLNPLAVPVKIADLKDNSNLDRIPNPTDVDLERVKKYQKAIELLSAD